ncbi:MAG TPA: protein kinase [Pseudonocardiaceae bacterium]|nr:protein kinase [Pseudonocardiaceae bacterium]
MLTSGQLLADRYRLARRIAVGGMGEVWEAEDTRLDRHVAVKVLKPELCGDAEFLHRFRTEARTTASLNHPGIAGVHDYGETAATPGGPQDTAYLVMELVDGEPLAAIIARLHRLPADFTLDLLAQAGNALQAAHERGYVHRDVKPGNIMVSTDQAGKHVVKLTDFGIAKAADAAPVTRSGMVMGTAHYIAPEQALGEEAEPASDVYSLAVVGYECLVGHRPFLSENAVTVALMHIRDLPPPLPPDVPPGMRALIEATLVKDPRQRYRNGGEFAAAAAAVRAGMPLPTPSGLTMAGQGQLPPQPGPAGPLGSPPHGMHGVPSVAIPTQGQPPMSQPMSAPMSGQMPQPQMALPPALGGGTMPPSAPVPPPGMLGERSRSIRPLWLPIGLLVLLLIALGIWVLTQNIRHASGGTPQPVGMQETSSATVAGVSDGLAPIGTAAVHARGYVGKGADVAMTQLRTLGLRTTLRTTSAGRADPTHCVVGAVTPTGDVTIGTVVTVTCTPEGRAR